MPVLRISGWKMNHGCRLASNVTNRWCSKHGRFFHEATPVVEQNSLASMQATGVSCKGINQHCPRSHYSFFIEGTTRTSISLERSSEQTPLTLSHIKQYVAKCRLTKAQSQGQILQNESNGYAGDDMMPPSCTSTFRSTCPSWSAIRSLSSWGTGNVVGSLFCRCFPKIS